MNFAAMSLWSLLGLTHLKAKPLTQPTQINRPPSHKIARLFYRLLWWVLTPIVPIYLRHRATRAKEDPQRLFERRGITSLLRPRGPLVWIHGASVGESLSALALIDRLLRERSDLSVLVTTGTVTSAVLMDARLPARAFHQYAPIDHPLYVSRFLRHWRPNAALWFESEFWPNLLVASQKKNMPMALVNARMSEKSFEGWRKRKWAIAPILRGFQKCFAQNDRVAEMLTELGARNVSTSGNLKFVADALPDNEEERHALESCFEGRSRIAAFKRLKGKRAS